MAEGASTFGSSLRRILAGLAPMALLVSVAAAQSPAPPPEAKPQAPAGIENRRSELRGLEDTISASEEQRRKIEAEIETIRTDRFRLNAALIDTTDRVHAAETKVDDIESASTRSPAARKRSDARSTAAAASSRRFSPRCSASAASRRPRSSCGPKTCC